MLKFLSLEKEAFGLDISDLSLKIAKLKKKRNGFKLVSFLEKEIKPGIIEEGVIKKEEELAGIVKDAVKNVEGKKLNTKYVVASLPEEKSFLQIIQMPDMKDEELKTAVFFEAENYIPLPVSEVYLDFKAISSIKNQSGRLNVMIAASPKKIVNSYVNVLKKAGLIPVALEIESEAIARALIKEGGGSQVALVDFGRTNTSLIVFYENSVYFTCSMPVSSKQLTEAISKELKISFDRAEKIKIKYDMSKKDRTVRSKEIFRAMSVVLYDLVDGIKKYLNFYQDHASEKHNFPKGKIEKIFLSGGGSDLKGLSEFLSKNLKIPVEPAGFSVNILQKNHKKSGFKCPLPFAAAIGLALKKINET